MMIQRISSKSVFIISDSVAFRITVLSKLVDIIFYASVALPV